MALHPDFAVETAANRNHTNFSGTIGDLKACILRITVNLLYGTGSRSFYNASLPLFLSNRGIFIGYVLPVRAKEEDSSSNIVPGTTSLQNLYFEQEDEIADVHPLLYTGRNFSDKLQPFTLKWHLYCNNRWNYTSNVYPYHDTPQLYWNKVQTFTARAQIFGARVQNDGATLKNAGNRSYQLCSKRRPFAFCNKTVCTLAYPFSCSFKPSMYNSKF